MRHVDASKCRHKLPYHDFAVTPVPDFSTVTVSTVTVCRGRIKVWGETAIGRRVLQLHFFIRRSRRDFNRVPSPDSIFSIETTIHFESPSHRISNATTRIARFSLDTSARDRIPFHAIELETSLRKSADRPTQAAKSARYEPPTC